MAQDRAHPCPPIGDRDFISRFVGIAQQQEYPSKEMPEGVLDGEDGQVTPADSGISLSAHPSRLPDCQEERVTLRNFCHPSHAATAKSTMPMSSAHAIPSRTAPTPKIRAKRTRMTSKTVMPDQLPPWLLRNTAGGNCLVTDSLTRHGAVGAKPGGVCWREPTQSVRPVTSTPGRGHDAEGRRDIRAMTASSTARFRR